MTRLRYVEFVLVGLVAVINGCRPAYERVSPEISGLVVDGKKAVAGIEVKLSVTEADEKCSRASRATITDEFGKFTFPSVSRINFKPWPYAGDYSPGNHYVCLKARNRNYYGWGSYYDTRERLALNCELNESVRSDFLKDRDQSKELNKMVEVLNNNNRFLGMSRIAPEDAVCMGAYNH